MAVEPTTQSQTGKLTQLDHYRLLGRSGLRVSPLALGTMTFGTDWGWGADKDECRKIFERYAELGGNFIDTANRYTNGTAETFVGEFVKGRRDQFVIATKYTLNMRAGDPNAGGSHRKNLVQSLEASLKRLQMDYVDLYWVHAWDRYTPIEEVMRALDDVVRQGKVLCIGISDAPAWKVAQANTLASLRGWSPFVALQIQYSLIERTSERDLIPMAQEFGLGVTPWAILGSGVLTGKHSRPDNDSLRGDRGRLRDERNRIIVDEVVKVAQEIGYSPAQVAINWVLQRPGVTSPLIGARTLQQFEDNVAALDFTLSADQVARLNKVSEIDLGFPHNFITPELVKDLIAGNSIIIG
jgi:aryl-alcohol dehydrogenase-like predicted oxidoreductase